MASPRDDWRTPRLNQNDYQAAIDALERLPVVRMLAERAREGHMPYSAAVRLWGQRSDMAMEFALDAVKARESLERCPNCGTNDKHWLNDIGRPLKHGYLQVDIEGCQMCQLIHREIKDMPEEVRHMAIPRIKPKPFGESHIASHKR